MAVLTVRNVPDEVHRALRVRAAEHGRSAEAEVREILSAAPVPSPPPPPRRARPPPAAPAGLPARLAGPGPRAHPGGRGRVGRGTRRGPGGAADAAVIVL